MTFQEWKEYTNKVHGISDRNQASLLARARKTARKAGLSPEMPFLHAHNAMCSFSYGKPWKEVDYKLARKVLWLEQKGFEQGRTASKAISKAWDTVEMG